MLPGENLEGEWEKLQRRVLPGASAEEREGRGVGVTSLLGPEVRGPAADLLCRYQGLVTKRLFFHCKVRK